MPGQRSARGRRAGGAARITGIVAVVALAVAGAVIYLLSTHTAATARTAPPPPDKVISQQAVGLVTLTAGPHGGVPTQLELTSSGLHFVVVPAAELAAGQPMWTADQMKGGSYTFIYIPDGRCLSVSVHGSRATIDLQHCNLGAAQRWFRVGRQTTISNHVYGSYRSMVSKLCLSHPAAGPSTPAGQVALGSCTATPPGQQLIAFWWSL